MMVCTRKLEFDAAHRVMLHESKCKYLHGHRYVVEASFTAKDNTNTLDTLGRVIDFGVIKTVLGAWLDEHWDHNVILCKKDEKLGHMINTELSQNVYFMDDNPTAENMADYLLRVICPMLFVQHDVICINIRLYETPNCSAYVSL